MPSVDYTEIDPFVLRMTHAVSFCDFRVFDVMIVHIHGWNLK